jgi:hypothetical protein
LVNEALVKEGEVSGAKIDRPELAKVLRRLEAGDVTGGNPPGPPGEVDDRDSRSRCLRRKMSAAGRHDHIHRTLH